MSTTTYDAAEIAAEAAERGEDVLASVVFQALGAASACWENLHDAGIFESDRAKEIGDNLVNYLRDHAA